MRRNAKGQIDGVLREVPSTAGANVNLTIDARIQMIAEEALRAAPADEAMITSTVCEIVWFAGLVAWYVIRYPFERRAK